MPLLLLFLSRIGITRPSTPTTTPATTFRTRRTSWPSLNASIPVSERLRAGVETQYVSSRQIEGNSIPAYATTNFTLSTARPWHGVDLSASVYNAFDRKYVGPFDNGAQGGLMPQDERNYRIKATYRF